MSALGSPLCMPLIALPYPSQVYGFMAILVGLFLASLCVINKVRCDRNHASLRLNILIHHFAAYRSGAVPQDRCQARRQGFRLNPALACQRESAEYCSVHDTPPTLSLTTSSFHFHLAPTCTMGGMLLFFVAYQFLSFFQSLLVVRYHVYSTHQATRTPPSNPYQEQQQIWTENRIRGRAVRRR